MGIFGRGPDRTRALRDRRIQRLREDAPEEERGAILGTIPSLGAATAILSATLIGTSVVALIVYGPAFALVLGVPLTIAAGLMRATLEGREIDLAAGVEYAISFALAYALAVILCRRVTGRPALFRAGHAAGVVLAGSLFISRALLEPDRLFGMRFPPPNAYDFV